MMLINLLSHFSVASAGCQPKFFGFKTWYHYLQTNSKCEVINLRILPTDGRSDLLLIGLAIVDDLLQLAGLVAIGYVIYGGILYVTSQGSPEQTGKAQSTIQNALVGLLIVIISISVVSFIGSRLR
jgi:hypothetical protein